jgi:ABC-type multidrug transport system ATPase subunit
VKGLSIEARRVCRTAGRVSLLSGVTLMALPGEVVALVGPSGAGKSTLLHCLNGNRAPDTGSVLYDGCDLYADRDLYLRHIGFVPQDDVVHLSLTAEASLTYALRLRRPELDSGAVEARVTEVLERLELTARRGLRVERLSGGQRKRVSIGMELVASPAALFLDEPTSGLDPALEEKMMDLFRSLAGEGRTLMVTTHVMDSLAQVDHLAVLYSGNLAFFGPPARALGYFGVGECSALFRRLPERSPAEWAEAFASGADAKAAALRTAPAPRDGAAPPAAGAPPAPAAGPEATIDAIERELEALKEQVRRRG